MTMVGDSDGATGGGRCPITQVWLSLKDGDPQPAKFDATSTGYVGRATWRTFLNPSSRHRWTMLVNAALWSIVRFEVGLPVDEMEKSKTLEGLKKGPQRRYIFI